MVQAERETKPREIIPKKLRFPIIMHEWLDSPEHSSAADSIEQAIEIFSATEDIYTNSDSHNFDVRLGILGNPTKNPSVPHYRWTRFTNIDGEGWRHELDGHYAYFYDNGGILVTRSKPNLEGTLTLGPEFQKYGR
ncbi:MAG: hypothetical protein EOO18_11150 [Chryseobacterium sp.]|nr:MAG: hypothetical protein EOO18_11150 [Chryseobacterium sp.]